MTLVRRDVDRGAPLADLTIDMERAVFDDRLDEIRARQLVRAMDAREIRKHVEVRDGDRGPPDVFARHAARDTTFVLHYRSTREAAIADVGRAIAMAAGGALAF